MCKETGRWQYLHRHEDGMSKQVRGGLSIPGPPTDATAVPAVVAPAGTAEAVMGRSAMDEGGSIPGGQKALLNMIVVTISTAH